MKSNSFTVANAFIFGMLLALAACDEPKSDLATKEPAEPATVEVMSREEAQEALSKEFNGFLDNYYETFISRYPRTLTRRNRSERKGEWNDYTDTFDVAEAEWRAEQLTEMRVRFELPDLNEKDKIAYRTFEIEQAERLERFEFRHQNYSISQRAGFHITLATTLLRDHQINTEADVEAYISRLEGIDTAVKQFVADLEWRTANGYVLPKFAYPIIHDSISDITSGLPTADGDSNKILAKLEAKMAELGLPDKVQAAHLERAKTAADSVVLPSFIELDNAISAMETHATGNHGVWNLPGGEAYYQHRLRRYTKSDKTADEIHAFGLSEIERIHSEMLTIMRSVGFDGTLQEFFIHLKTNPQFAFPDNDEGRKIYLDQANVLLEEIALRLPTYFGIIPKAQVEVRRVESYREKGASNGQYSRPPEDFSRPGYFYVNLVSMERHRTFGVQTLVHHEALPGHHFQTVLSMEQAEVPAFMRYISNSTYAEGWALYSERLAKEMGLYEGRPYADFGRLNGELFRAIRLVVDTGLHAKKWTREEAIAYMVGNSATEDQQATSEIQRYITTPGQALAYKMGMHRFLDMRAHAREELGEVFDIKVFHDLMLKNGRIPFPLLEELVDEWIAEMNGAEQ